MSNLHDFAPQLDKFARDGHRQQFHSQKNLASALVAAAVELLEHFQWLSVQFNHGAIEIDLAADDWPEARTDLGRWLILPPLADRCIAIDVSGQDEPLLLELAQAEVVLSRPDGAHDFKEVAVHDASGHGSFMCHRSRTLSRRSA